MDKRLNEINGETCIMLVAIVLLVTVIIAIVNFINTIIAINT